MSDTDTRADCGPQCPECNDTGERDSGGTYPWGEPIYLACDCKDAEVGRRWRQDSSLEAWFPITAKRLAALEAENAELKRCKWQPIETAPRGKTLLLWHPCYGMPAVGHNVAGDIWTALEPGVAMLFQRHIEPPTHWMPLPAPPKER